MSTSKIITVSCKVKSAPSAGHDYWFHHVLRDALEKADAGGMILGARSEQSQTVNGVLEYSWAERHTSSFWVWKHQERDVENILKVTTHIESNVEIVFHFYEGGFREFFTAALICLRSPTSKVIFNFNLTDAWNVLLSKSRRPINRAVISAIRNICEALSGQLILTCETPALAELFTCCGIEVSNTYPLFSTCANEPNGQIPLRRPVDITLFPNGNDEFELCLQIASKLIHSESTSASRMLFVPRWGYRPTTSQESALRQLGIRVSGGVLSEEDYTKLYASTVVSFFPYVGEYYKFSSSGRLLDALASGSRAYAPIDSSLFQTIQTFSGGGGFHTSRLDSLIDDLTVEFSEPQDVPIAPPTPARAVELLKEISSLQRRPFSTSGDLNLRRELRLASLINFALGFRYSFGKLVDSVAALRTASRFVTSSIRRMRKSRDD